MLPQSYYTSFAAHLFDSCRALNVHSVIALILATFLTFTAQAIPENIENYEVLQGGLTDIKNGAYVEGSLHKGGAQPDYFIDLNSEPIKSLLQSAQRIGQEKLSFWDTVGLVTELVRTDFFRYVDYNNPYYRRLLKKYRLAKKDMPLSEYGACSAGVCREHALVLHFALKAAGISNRHAYAKIYRASKFHNFEIIEDHAFNVLEHRGVQWVVDAYYWGFNGFRFKDLQSKNGITEKSLQAPVATPNPGTRRIININEYPKIYNPKLQAPMCASAFL